MFKGTPAKGSSTHSFLVTNSGERTARLSLSCSPPFSITPSSAAVQAGEMLRCHLHFTPMTQGLPYPVCQLLCRGISARVYTWRGELGRLACGRGRAGRGPRIGGICMKERGENGGAPCIGGICVKERGEKGGGPRALVEYV